MQAINDPHDDMMLAPRDTTVVTQATAANDTFPAPYDVEEGMTILSGLGGAPAGGVRSARTLRDMRRAKPLSHPMDRRIPMQRSHGKARFIPGMGDLEGAPAGGVRSARTLRDMRRAKPLSHPMDRRIPMQRSHGKARFIPGMGDLEGPMAAPARMRTKVRARGHAAAHVNRIRRPGGFMPGMGAFDLAASPGIMLLVGAAALYMLARK